jgi:hypothetical protein
MLGGTNASTRQNVDRMSWLSVSNTSRIPIYPSSVKNKTWKEERLKLM